jgi:multidrug efflux pump subunit AcrB
MSKFFIDRPIFAWVIALVIMLVGALSILNLPINQYPAIAPPAIAIQVTYPGASAQTVQDTVVQVIEQQMNGIDNLRYISSESNSDGSMTITVTFNQGDQPGHRAGSGTEQAEPGDPAAAPRGATAGPARDQGREELPVGGRSGIR